MNLTNQDYEILVAALNRGWYNEPKDGPNTPHFMHLINNGYLQQTELNPMMTTCEITEQGKRALRDKFVFAVQINIPDQHPLILRNSDALVSDIRAGILETTFELLEDGDYESGAALFSVEAKRISLYDLATLPEWDAI